MTPTEMRSCLRQHFEEQALGDRHALEQSSLNDLVEYFKILSREAKHGMMSRTELELVSRHQKVLWGHKFPIFVLDSRGDRSSTNPSSTLDSSSNESSPNSSIHDSSPNEYSSNSSSTEYVHVSGLVNESRMAIGPGPPPRLHLPIRSRTDLPRPPPRAHLSGQGAVARLQLALLTHDRSRAGTDLAAVEQRSGDTNALNTQQQATATNHGSTLEELGRELYIRHNNLPGGTPNAASVNHLSRRTNQLNIYQQNITPNPRPQQRNTNIPDFTGTVHRRVPPTTLVIRPRRTQTTPSRENERHEATPNTNYWWHTLDFQEDDRQDWYRAPLSN